MTDVPDSLSVVLPVYNSAATLAERVSKLLEILPEITPRFELLILDNGSSDATEEVAHELARQFPQLRVLRNAVRQGREETTRTGYQASVGDLVVVYDERAPIRQGELQRLWTTRRQPRHLPRQAASGEVQELLQRLSQWTAQLQKSASSPIRSEPARPRSPARPYFAKMPGRDGVRQSSD